MRNFVDIRKERAKVLYEEDKNLPLRKSHDNPVVKKCYAEYLASREAIRLTRFSTPPILPDRK